METSTYYFPQKGEYMRFNYEAYEKVFPKETPKPTIESAVDTFKPTEQESGKPMEQAGEDVMASVPAEPEGKPEDTTADNQPEGGTNE